MRCVMLQMSLKLKMSQVEDPWFMSFRRRFYRHVDVEGDDGPGMAILKYNYKDWRIHIDIFLRSTYQYEKLT